MYKFLRMAHEKLLMCETNLHRCGLYLAIPLTLAMLMGRFTALSYFVDFFITVSLMSAAKVL